jgi:hygromycin-B 7''-O-kinase
MSQASSTSDDSAIIVDAIRRELSLGAGIERFASGSVPVFAVGDGYVVKLFPAEERSFFDAERSALARIGGALSLATPRLIADGYRGHWWFIVMMRLPGQSLAEAWPEIGVRERFELMRQLGAGLAELHAIGTDGLDSLVMNWPRFVDVQRISCRERQLAKGLGFPWVDAIDDFLDRRTPSTSGPLVLLHTEIMREHLLVERSQGGWQLSGLFDFEPAMIGHREYEFASAGLFLTCGEPGLLRALLDAYGAEIDAELPLRLMAYALLHRYSNLRWNLERLPTPNVDGDLERLAHQWFYAGASSFSRYAAAR